MMKAASDYILANCPPDNSGEVTETQTPEQTGVDMKYIFDNSDLLTFDEWEKLEARAADISQRHGCGVYVAFVDDFTKYGDGNDVYKTTYQLYHANELGMGENRDGIIILLSMADRDYAMFVYGENAEKAFDKYGQEQLEDTFLGYFGDNDWYNGVSSYLDTCDEYLTLAEEGNPVRKNTLPMYIIVVVASCAISGFICLMLKQRMQTVHKKAEANEYVADGGLQLTEQYDPQPNTFGIVEGATVTGGMHFGRLECSQIGLDCPVYYGANRVCLRAGAAASTAYGLPGYGKSTVVTGYNTTVFRNLGQLKKGDLIDFSTNWGHFSYRVTDRQVLTSDESVDVSVVDKEKLILFCTYPQSPFGNLADQRLYVFCEKASGPAVEVSTDD